MLDGDKYYGRKRYKGVVKVVILKRGNREDPTEINRPEGDEEAAPSDI